MRPLRVTFKRLSLLAGRGARAFASLVWLTPQRCDLMWCLRQRPLIQRDLAFEMGVVRSVVSKMVTALEKLGIVERRGVEGDRRLRLVVLTERAFDLMNTLLDHGFFEDRGETVQGDAERYVLEQFRGPLEAEKVGVTELSAGDHRSLLARIRAEIVAMKHADWIGYELRRDATRGPPWRYPRTPWDAWTKARHVPEDVSLATMHRGAGIALDERQRHRRHRQPRTQTAS